MDVNGVKGNQGKIQSSSTDFKTFADRLNGSFPDQTTTIAEKKKAISAKKQIMAHPDCPSDTKSALQNEIGIIEREIKQMQMDKSVFS